MNSGAGSKNVLVIHGSHRYESDTRKFIEFTFARTPFTFLDLNDYSVEEYNYDGVYSGADEFKDVMEIALSHRIIVFATPVYWYAMSGKMKDLFDRFTDLLTIDKPTGKKLQGKKVALLAVGNDLELPEGFIVPFRDTANYLSMKYIGDVYFSSARPMDSSNAMAAKAEFIRKLNQISS